MQDQVQSITLCYSMVNTMQTSPFDVVNLIRFLVKGTNNHTYMYPCMKTHN